MRRLSTLLLLCAAGLIAYANALPYSKIDVNADGFTSKKSSRSSNSHSFNQNNEFNLELNGQYNGQPIHGTKHSVSTNKGESFSQNNEYSTSSLTGSIPIGLISSSANAYATAGANSANDAQLGYAPNPGTGSLQLQQTSQNAGGYDYNAQDSTGQNQYGASATSVQTGQAGQAGHVAGTQYWWMSQSSPFAVHGQQQSSGCSSNGCSSSSSLHITSEAGSANEGDQAEIKLHNNPFLNQGHQSVGTSSGASSSGNGYAFGSASATGFATSGQTGNRMDVSKNPFLNGIGVASGSSSGYGSQNHHESGIHHGSSSGQAVGSQSNVVGNSNPFFNAGSGGSDFQSHHESANHHDSSSTSGQAADDQSNVVGNSNPFFNAGSNAGGFQFFGQQKPQIPSIPSVPQISSVSGGSGSNNPFFKPPQVPQVPQYPEIPHIPQIPQIPNIPQINQDGFGDQQVAGFPSFSVDNGGQKISQDGGLSVSCNGQNRICVAKNLCSIEGYVISNDIHQVRTGPQVCKIPNEVCCNLRSNSGDQSQAGTSDGHSKISTSFGTNYNQGGIFGSSSGNQEVDLSTGEIVSQQQEGLFGNSKDAADSNGYLPPLGSEPSSNVPAFSKPPAGEEPQENEGEPTDSFPTNIRPNAIFPPAPAPPVQLGCAAALICVEEQFCTLEGVISPEPVSFSSNQLLRRVPLSSCKNPDNGVIGKCCRDPNYVDPWPAGNLPANYSGGFDEQGFPTFLMISKTRPTKKPSTSGNAIKGGRKPIVPSYNPQTQTQRAPSFGPFPNFPNIQNPFRPTAAAPQDQGLIHVTPAPFPPFPNPTTSAPNPIQSFPGFPSRPNRPTLPNLPNPFGNKNNFDASPSNENPTIIAPHVPGTHCGLRNKVQRPSGLSDVDVAFGEIPWQAMILSNQDRKLLCSGAIVAPNAIVTAARCVEGYKPSQVSIKTGEWKLGYELKHEEPLPFEIVNVASIAPYPAYSTGNPANDVAILFLEHDVKLDQHVDMLCLPEGQPQPPQPGRKCISTGWGKTILQVNAAGSLMHSIDVDVLSNEQCQQRLNGAENHIDLHDSLVCTKAHRQNNNMCQVDLGGPLACDRGDGYYELAGVYNQDTGCLPTNQIATFATIPTSWVQEMMANPPQSYIDETQSPSSGGTKQIIHNHGPNEPCDCQKSNLPSENNQYLPPQ